jgi:hypothetical protein
MRLDKQHLVVLAVAATTALGACRSRVPESGTTDSATTSARTDSAPSSTANATVPSDSVLLRTDKTQYKAGEQLTLTFENKGASRYAFNPCTRLLEREEAGSWVPMPDEGRMCTMEAWILEPRGTRTGPTELPSPLAPGRYRVVVRMTVEPPGGAQTSAITAVSDPITVS